MRQVDGIACWNPHNEINYTYNWGPMKKQDGQSFPVPLDARVDNRLYIERAYSQDPRYLETISDRQAGFLYSLFNSDKKESMDDLDKRDLEGGYTYRSKIQSK
jgi:hypothetical protein